MLDTMKKVPRSADRRGQKLTVTMSIRISKQLHEAIQRALAEIDPPTTAAGLIDMGLRKALAELGFWPPPDDVGQE